MGSFLFRLFIALLLISPAATFAASPKTAADLLARAREKKLWQNQQWLYLVHYRKGLFGGEDAQPDGKEFFLAPNGMTDPEAELLATIDSFFRTPTTAELTRPKEMTPEEIEARLKQARYALDGRSQQEIEKKVESMKREMLVEAPAQHPICKFPARLRFIERELDWGGEGLPKVTCYRLDDFRKRLDAQSASLVFSSFFLNNPSSTFGHSFIRINSGNWSQYGNYRNELLDTGINYAANSEGVNALLYPLLGMAGMLPGSFTALPYYYKVREYNDYESRDLWSYDLNLSKDEIAMLVDHIWEEGSTFYYYKYFTENCSYHMLTLLDAAAPRLGLQERVPFYVIPSDTIRVLTHTPGLVSNISYRPSILSQFRYRLSRLDPTERVAYDRMIDAKSLDVLDPKLSKDSQAELLDTYSDQIELNHASDLMKDGSETQKLKQAILVKRASLGVKSPPLDVPSPLRSAPHLAHGIRRVTLGFAGEKGQKGSEVFGYKFAMNELLDPGLGYPRNTQIDFGRVQFRYRNIQAQRHVPVRERIEFDEIGLFQLTALTPYSHYYSSKSTHADFGWKKSIDRECEGNHRCLPLTLNYAPGFAYDPSHEEDLTLYAFLGGRAEYTPGFLGSNIRLGAGPRLGVIVYFSDTLRFETGAEAYARLWAKEKTIQYETDGTLRWGFVKPWAIDITAKRARDWTEAAARLHFYY